MLQTVDQLLAARARTHRDKILLSYRDERLTYETVDRLSGNLAGALQREGVAKADPVCLMLPNCPDYIVAWMAACKLGAIQVGINTEYTSKGLVHLLELSEAKVLVLDESYVVALAEVADELTCLETIILRGNPGVLNEHPRLARFRVIAYAEAIAAPLPWTAPSIAPSDLLMLIFTSGTTGPAKAVSISHGYCLDMARDLTSHLGYREDDVIYSCYPLFHTDAAILTYIAALDLGATTAIGEKFSASRFWDDIRRHQATIFDFMGAVLAILYKQPPSPSDRDHRVRLAMGGPRPEIWPEFSERFGIQVTEIYGSTECGHVCWALGDDEDRAKRGTCGKVDFERYQVRIADDDDRELPVGEIGEILVRPNFAHQHMSGYFRDPVETTKAWRNLWYHTRDLGRIDEDGWLYYHGRRSDAIRKRGNNMSAHEIEEVMMQHPAVLEVAAIGVPSELTEEEVKAVVVLRDGQACDPAVLVDWCRSRMPKYMVPRYVEFCKELPKSSTGKVQKKLLRDNWRNASTFDAGDGRQAAAGAVQ
ncbi:AMP-binding protein [Chelatococcus sp. GCM10030263]|uniref:AMP-binding protein n=1 Tax=Chelatococcus sp. GCM10030263 TaxID=3273387 RepID=UPI00360758D0